MEKFTFASHPSIFRRFAALFYDFFLTFAILLVSMALIIILRLLLDSPIAPTEVAISGLWRIPALCFCVFNVSLFHCYFWVKNGQTLGMQSWRLAIVGENGGHINWLQAYSRFFIAFFSVLPCFAGYLWVFFDPEKQTLHDRLSGTRTIVVDKQ